MSLTPFYFESTFIVATALFWPQGWCVDGTFHAEITKWSGHPFFSVHNIKKYSSCNTFHESLPQQIKRRISEFKKETDIILSWEDADGDKIVVGTDEHLALALGEMPGPVYKFNVLITPEDCDDDDSDDDDSD